MPRFYINRRKLSLVNIRVSLSLYFWADEQKKNRKFVPAGSFSRQHLPIVLRETGLGATNVDFLYKKI